jgi:hypothetical protein
MKLKQGMMARINGGKRPFHTIDPAICEMIASIGDGTYSKKYKRQYILECGDVDQVIATGRAKCRCCGKKIFKAEKCWRFYWDFTGNGSRSASPAYIHKKCSALTKALQEGERK